jgi:hypothetical protein
MMADAEHWHQANQRYLSAALAVVRARLENHASSGAGRGKQRGTLALNTAHNDLKLAAESLPLPSTLETVCAAFGLSSFEREILLLCAGTELEGRFRGLCASAG